MIREHQYNVNLNWTGNTGNGTAGYHEYERSYTFQAKGKPDIYGSSDPLFRGDRSKYNPEELLVASLSSCHMLWYLHLWAEEGIVVVDYSDNAIGVMEETANGGGKFKEVILNPFVVITDESKIDTAIELHGRANELCFIASSVNFPVHHRPVTKKACFN